MRVLADMGVAQSTVRALRELGHDVVHVAESGLHELPDVEILSKARDEKRTVLTFDLDFGDLLAATRDPLPSVIMVRLTDQRPSSATPKVVRAIEQFAKELATGALLVVEDARCRLRRLPF